MKAIKTLLILLLLLPGCKKEDIPTVKTGDVASITRTTAICRGEILSQGDSEVTERGICWSTTDKPLITDNIKVDDSDGNSFTVDLTDLEPDTEYFVRAYATNYYGTGYGKTKSFYTEPATIPRVVTYSFIHVTQNSANLSGNIYPDEGLQLIDYGFCWNTSENPSISDNYVSVSADLSFREFYASITGLQSNTKYYMRAYATHPYGIVYGNSASFTTCSDVSNTSYIGTWYNVSDMSCGYIPQSTMDKNRIEITSDSIFSYYVYDQNIIMSGFGIKPAVNGYDSIYFFNPPPPQIMTYLYIRLIDCNNMQMHNPFEVNIDSPCEYFKRII